MKIFVIEGINGAGKSTIVHGLMQKMEKLGIKVQKFSDPGSTQVGLKLRALLKDPSLPMDSRVQLLLYVAARLDLWKYIDTEVRESGTEVVLLDRWIHSTMAYQGQKTPVDLIEDLHDLFGLNMKDPEQISHTVILHVSLELAMARVAKAKGQDFQADRFESQGYSFLSAVQNSYLNLAKSDLCSLVDVSNDDAAINIENVWQEILPHLDLRGKV